MIPAPLKSKLFENQDYRKFLRQIVNHFADVRGYKTKLSNYVGCQPAYFSQVMAGQVEFTPEQAEKLCSFLELDEIESDYLFNLVMLSRAGTQSLKRKLESKLDELKIQWRQTHATFGKPSVEEPSRASIYYSHWLHSAVHLLLTIPAFQTAKALAEHFQKAEKDILSVLEELESAGLALKNETGWKATHVNIHATEKDFFAEVHHKNWRAQGLELRKTSNQSSVRYTSIHSLSKKDYEKISSLIEEMIQNSRSIIEPSPEEMAACLIIDYFKI